MWIVASRERPHKLKRFLAACLATRVSTPIVVVVDETDPHLDKYGAIDCELVVRPGESVGAVDKFRFAFNQNPNAPWYGLLPDDCEPTTKGWDVAMVAACSPDRIAYCKDGMPKQKRCMPAIGGDLLRAFGDVSPKGLHHYGIDRFWRNVAIRTGRMVDVRNHMLRLTDRVLGEPESSWDAPKRRQKERQHEDKEAWRELAASGYFDTVIKRLAR